MLKIKNRSKLPLLRTRLVMLCVGTILIVLTVSLTVFLVLINNVLGSSLKSDLEFALRETSNNLSIKATLVEDVLQAIRKDEILLAALSGKGLVPKTSEQSDTEDALRAAADLYSDKNIESISLPFIDMVYLFDLNGVFNNSAYGQFLSAVQAQTDSEYQRLYLSFVESGKDVSIEKKGNHVNIIYTLYNEWMEPIGTAIFAINCSAIEAVMSKAEDYKNAFWAVFDKEGISVMQSGTSALSPSDEQYISSVHKNNTYEYQIDDTGYLVYTQFLSMGLRCAIGVPADQLSVLLYRAVLPYFCVTVILVLIVGALLFVAILRLTKPLFEVATNLQRVAEKHFDVKLPPYNNEEFNTISTTFNSMTDTIHHLINDVYETKLLAKESEITVLQSQVNPHFMYNVLHTIALKAKMDGNEDVYKMASNFAGLTKARLSHSGDDKVSLEQELQYVRFYLDLQKYRFNERLKYSIVVENPCLLKCRVPRLMLEMIVENAVVHGIEPKADPGNVFIDISQSEQGITILIEDDGVGFVGHDGFVPLPLQPKAATDNAHNHIALNNAYKLLHHFYGDGYGISIQSRQDVGSVVKILIPKEEDDV